MSKSTKCRSTAGAEGSFSAPGAIRHFRPCPSRHSRTSSLYTRRGQTPTSRNAGGDADDTPVAPSRGMASLDEPLRRSMGRILDAALELEGGNRSRAAQRLDISSRTILRYLANGTRSAQP
jgi:DNA-binding NtrC family response regulator